ncbi:MAG: phage holin family protein [Microlunatus sp.]|nr:phage holin family protein [Microlunatus sp.]
MRRRRLWVLAPMALAWLLPYGVANGDIVARLPAGALTNEAGVTYCMVTPLVLGLMILYADGVHHSTLSVAAWVGLIFGVVNALIWFLAVPQSWWMGVLHLPLLVLSGYASWLSRRTPAGPPRFGSIVAAVHPR